MIAALRAAETKTERSGGAGKKEGGWGEGIFARPRLPVRSRKAKEGFSAAAEFSAKGGQARQLKTGAPP